MGACDEHLHGRCLGNLPQERKCRKDEPSFLGRQHPLAHQAKRAERRGSKSAVTRKPVPKQQNRERPPRLRNQAGRGPAHPSSTAD